jgi:hypothetical protein
LPIANFQLVIARRRNTNRQSAMLLGFLVASVFATTATKLLKLKPVWRGLFVLGRYVVAALAVSTLENNIVTRHNSSPFPIANFQMPIKNRSLYFVVCPLSFVLDPWFGLLLTTDY